MTYKNQLINSVKNKYNDKIKTLKGLKEEIKKENLKELTWYEEEALTDAQYKAFKNKDALKFNKMIDKSIVKLELQKDYEIKQTEAKINALIELKDIKELTIKIDWKKSQMWGYNCMASATVQYQNGTYKRYETGYTSGCGYDKESTSISQIFNELCEVVFLKHFKKIHDRSLYAFNGGKYSDDYRAIYAQYGVGSNCYITAMKELGYKVNNNIEGVYIFTKKA